MGYKFCEDGQGNLEMVERHTKTRTWENLERETESEAKYVVKLYSRQSNYCSPDEPFYLAMHTNKSTMEPNVQWFKWQPMGINAISTIMKRMSFNAGLSADKKLSNHIARKYLVQKLSNNNVSLTEIMPFREHKKVNLWITTLWMKTKTNKFQKFFKRKLLPEFAKYLRSKRPFSKSDQLHDSTHQEYK